MGLPTTKLFPLSRVMKRAIDMLGAIRLLDLPAPLFVYAALLIKLDSPGPIFFKQTRLGKGMREFTLLKFRTMHVDTDAAAHRDFIAATMSFRAAAGANGLYKLSRDDAITRVGRWLRRTSLDELPQLLNVLRGDMSLVGPRPCLAYEVERFAPHHFERFLVPAGPHRPVAGRSAGARELRRGARDGRRVRRRTGRSASTSRCSSGHRSQLVATGERRHDPATARRLGRRRRARLLGPEPRPKVLHELPDVEVAYVCDLSEEALDRVGRRYPAVRRQRDLTTYSTMPTVDAVVIATPVSTHYRLARAALEAGKHVFVEKPLAGSSGEALELVELAARTGSRPHARPHVPLQPAGQL